MKIKGILFCILCVSLQTFALSQKVVVLVPGFFNSLAPSLNKHPWDKPYWSQDISKIFANHGAKVYVVNTLNPIGELEENSRRLIKYLNSIYESNPQAELYLVGHSAGGLYSLYAASETQLPIKAIVTISTPFLGVKFLDRLLSHPDLFKPLLKFVRMESLLGLKQEAVAKFVDKLKVPDHLRVINYGGLQVRSFATWNARYFSVPFLITQALIAEPSDGIVAWASSFSTPIKTRSLGFLQVEQPIDYIRLEHWEQVLDHRFFRLLAVFNINYIQAEQLRFYEQVAQTLGL